MSRGLQVHVLKYRRQYLISWKTRGSVLPAGSVLGTFPYFGQRSALTIIRKEVLKINHQGKTNPKVHMKIEIGKYLQGITNEDLCFHMNFWICLTLVIDFQTFFPNDGLSFTKTEIHRECFHMIIFLKIDFWPFPNLCDFKFPKFFDISDSISPAFYSKKWYSQRCFACLAFYMYILLVLPVKLICLLEMQFYAF